MAECLIHRSGYSAKQAVITVPITDLTVYGGNNTNTTSYEYNGNGIVTATSSNTKVATVVVQAGNNVVVTYVSPGSAIITVNGSKTNKFKECSTAFNVTCARTSLTIPSLQSTSVAITGNSVGPGVNNYNSNLITQSGTTSTSSIGTYTVYWSIKDTNRYCWSDGSLTQKSQSWSTYGGTVTFYATTTGYNGGTTATFTCPYGTKLSDTKSRTFVSQNPSWKNRLSDISVGSNNRLYVTQWYSDETSAYGGYTAFYASSSYDPNSVIINGTTYYFDYWKKVY